jgi:hypothetical protein
MIMQARKAAQLRTAWVEKGSPRCGHPNLDKEYVAGSDTGDVVCTICGETWWRDDPERPDRRGDRGAQQPG